MSSAAQQLLAAYSKPRVYAVWNSADKNANIALSGSDLIASNTTSATISPFRSTIGKSSGKPYFEITVTGAVTNQWLGVATASASIADGNYIGSDVYGFGFRKNGFCYTNGTAGAFLAAYIANSVLGFALDIPNGTLVITKDGTSLGTAFTGMSGTFYIAGSFAINGSVTLNSGSSAFASSVPSGYDSGWYE